MSNSIVPARLNMSFPPIAAWSSGCRAETLTEALALTYQTNLILLSQSAQLEATNENPVQAEAGFRPTVSVQATANYIEAPSPQVPTGGPVEYNYMSGVFSVHQPIHNAGRAMAQVDAATAQILPGREQLWATEQSVFLPVVTAYCDVLRDRESPAVQPCSHQTLLNAIHYHLRPEVASRPPSLLAEWEFR